MEEKEVNCYLCGKEAKEEIQTESLNVRVRCPECPYYELTNMVMISYFKREDGKELFNDEHKKMIIEHLKKKFDSEQYEPTRITTQTIEDLTGIRTVN